MACAGVGWEIWAFGALATAASWVFLVATRPFVTWLLAQRPRRRSLQLLPREMFTVGSVKLLGLIPALMTIVAWLGVYCFFHGPDLPPIGR